MTTKPAYDQLKKRVRELEHTESELKKTKDMLKECEERYKQIFTIAPAGIYEVDFRSGKLVDVNDAICDYSGYTKDELLSMNAADLLTGESKKKFLDRIKRILNGETVSTDVEYAIHKKDGGIIRLNINNRFIYDGAHLVGATVVATDATERWKMEASLNESEKRYKELFDSSLDCIYLHDFEGNFIDANPAALNLLGYTKEEIQSLNFGFFLKENELSDAFEGVNEIIRTGRQEDLAEYELKKKNGDYVTVQTKGSLLFKEGKPWAIMGTARDITEYKRAQDKLRESERRYRLFAENVSDIIWTLDMNMDPTYYSPSITRLQGFTVEEALARPIEISMTPASFEAVSKVIAEELVLLSKGQSPPGRSRTVEVEFYCKDGSTIWAEVEAGFFYDDDGQAQGIIGVTRNITDRKKADEKLKKLHEELEERVEQRTRDLAKINYELEEKTVNLKEANTALKVLLKRREEDQAEVEDKILANVNELIIPLIDTIKGTKLDERQATWLDILETNLKDIVSPFSRGMSSKYWRLTPNEFQVAGFIKNGKTTKEIADLLHVATSTINTHRDNIRKKLGIKNRKINLKAYLSDLK